MELRADLPSVAAALAASLVAADGVIEDQEKKVATVLGARLMPGFSPLLFETLLDGISALPPAYELASHLRQFMEEKDKQIVMEYLVGIATADDRVVDVEQQELEAVATALGTEMPSLQISSVSG